MIWLSSRIDILFAFLHKKIPNQGFFIYICLAMPQYQDYIFLIILGISLLRADYVFPKPSHILLIVYFENFLDNPPFMVPSHQKWQMRLPERPFQ